MTRPNHAALPVVGIPPGRLMSTRVSYWENRWPDYWIQCHCPQTRPFGCIDTHHTALLRVRVNPKRRNRGRVKGKHHVVSQVTLSGLAPRKSRRALRRPVSDATTGRGRRRVDQRVAWLLLDACALSARRLLAVASRCSRWSVDRGGREVGWGPRIFARWLA